jgi:hypothetical protein
MEWEVRERPGYFGKMRDELSRTWDEEYGKGNWRIAYQWGNFIISREIGIQIYEDAYYDFLKKTPDVLGWLLSEASDIYDTAPTNVRSGLDYQIQETENNHIHDISIRRAILRLGKEFSGERLICIRSTDSEGYALSPGIVSFHLPDMIFEGEIKSYTGKAPWWKPKTIEDFYQRNKVLEVRSGL